MIFMYKIISNKTYQTRLDWCHCPYCNESVYSPSNCSVCLFLFCFILHQINRSIPIDFLRFFPKFFSPQIFVLFLIRKIFWEFFLCLFHILQERKKTTFLDHPRRLFHSRTHEKHFFLLKHLHIVITTQKYHYYTLQMFRECFNIHPKQKASSPSPFPERFSLTEVYN